MHESLEEVKVWCFLQSIRKKKKTKAPFLHFRDFCSEKENKRRVVCVMQVSAYSQDTDVDFLLKKHKDGLDNFFFFVFSCFSHFFVIRDWKAERFSSSFDRRRSVRRRHIFLAIHFVKWYREFCFVSFCFVLFV